MKCSTLFTEAHGLGNQAPTTNRALCRLIENSYDAGLLSGSGDTGVYQPVTPRRVTEYVLGQMVSLRYQTFVYGETRAIRCTGTNAPWNASSNLVTITTLYTNGFQYGELKSIEHPDGTMEFYEYVGTPYNTNGSTNTVSSGVPNSGKTAIVDGTKTVTVKGPLGQLLSTTTTDLQSSGTVIAQQLYGAFDVYARPQAVTNLDGTWEYSARFCCGDTVTTNREGSVITKTYDVLNRLLTSTANGVTHSNIYDAAGSVVRVERIGTNGNVIVQQRSAYDTAGHMTASTNALGEVTLFTESHGLSGVTNITTRLTNSSSGPQRIEARYLDGQTKSITGGLAHPVRYEYGPTNGGTFTKEIKLAANGSDTGEWTIQFYDTAGRPYKTLHADGAFSQTFYNAKGQPTNESDPDGVSKLTLYNPRGQPAYTVTDMNRDGVIDWSGTDRITWTTNYVVNNGVADVHRSETRVWQTNGANTPALVSVQESAVNGLLNWNASFGLTNRSETAYAGNGVRYSQSFAPDGAVTTTRFEGGRVTVSGRTNNGTALSATTFGYDAHNRQKFVTDARNGTTTNSFDDLDRVIARATPAPDSVHSSQRTGYRFDALGRVTAITNSDNTLLYKDYFESGELRKTWGAREYPVEYTYDAQGRMKTMKTWQDFSGNSGTAITTWNYDSARGWLANKRYADNLGPDYAYTPAGRLYQRIWARGVTTTYTTNAAGEIASIDYSDSTPDVTFTNDRLGRRTTIADGAGTHVLSYDFAGQLLMETNTAGVLAGFAITNAYDSLHRRFALGLVNESSTLANYGYDGVSRLVAVTNGVNAASYSYVANSPLVGQIAFKNSGTTRMTTTKSYDLLNRLTAITNLPSADSAVAFNYSHNAANQRVAITNLDGSRWVYEYDALGQVTSGKRYWSDGTPVLGQQFEYTFDDIGNRETAVTGGDANGTHKRLQSYTANNLNQYTQRTVPGYLDILGTATNTATVTVNNGSTARKSDYFRGEVSVANSSSPVWQGITNVAVLAVGTNDMVTNAIGHLFVPKTPEVFGYDADGNMTNDGRWTLTWDAENRLTKVESLSTSPAASKRKVTWDFDGQGRRVRQTTYDGSSGSYVATEDLKFVSDGWRHIAELNGTNSALIRSYVWGLDLSGSLGGAGGVGGLLMLNSTTSGAHCYGYDGNGNTAVLVSLTNGAASAAYDYDPFGRKLREAGAIAKENPFQFSTKRNDRATPFVHFEHRPSGSDRWLCRDPKDELGFQVANPIPPALQTADERDDDFEETSKAEPNLYSFVNNDAVNAHDPLGLALSHDDYCGKIHIRQDR